MREPTKRVIKIVGSKFFGSFTELKSDPTDLSLLMFDPNYLDQKIGRSYCRSDPIVFHQIYSFGLL